jgi:hypothetical protein
MATLIYPHLFCFSYHRKTKENPSIDPSWQTWCDRHKALQNANKPGRYAGDDWDAIYTVKDLGDTQGLLLYAAVREEHHPQPLNALDNLRSRLEGIEGAIGQTWLVLTQWQPEHETDTEATVIRDILKFWKLNPSDTKPQGSLVGNQLVSVSLASGQTLVICLAQAAENMTAFAYFHHELQRLFYYEHKIHWSYHQGQKIKQKLSHENFFPLTDEVIPVSNITLAQDQAIQGSFADLRQTLYNNMETLDRHTRGIEGLSLQLQTSKSNLKSYNKRLNRIQNLCKEYPCKEHPFTTKLTLWDDFAANQATFYQEQIQQDIESLSPGLRVREQHIKTLHVIVEAAQAERDRALENTIAAAGIGIGTSSAAASSWGGQDNAQPWPTFGWSIALGLGFGLAVYGLLWGVRGRDRR